MLFTNNENGKQIKRQMIEKTPYGASDERYQVGFVLELYKRRSVSS